MGRAARRPQPGTPAPFGAGARSPPTSRGVPMARRPGARQPRTGWWSLFVPRRRPPLPSRRVPLLLEPLESRRVPAVGGVAVVSAPADGTPGNADSGFDDVASVSADA